MGPHLAEDSSYQDSPVSSIVDSSHEEPKQQVHSPDLLVRPQLGVPPNSLSHRKFATEPDMSYLPPSQPIKAVTGDRRNMEPRQRNDSRMVAMSSPPSSAGPSNALRKVAPRAQVSTPVDQSAKLYEGGIRAMLPSTISSNVENMTGVGAGTGRFSPNAFYTPPYSGIDSAGKPISADLPFSAHTPPRSKSVTPTHVPYSHLPVSTRSKTPPLLVSHLPSPPSSPPRGAFSPPEQQGDTIANTPSSARPGSGRGTPPLLGAGAFRDSAFSSSSQATYYVPIKTPNEKAERDREGSERSRRSVDNRISSILPGGWQPSPVEEEPEMDGVVNCAQSPADDSNTEGGPETPIHEVGSRVSSPELNRPDSGLRKSEAAVVGMIVNSVPSPPPLPRPGHDKRKDSLSSGTGQGWVLVNVDGMVPPSPVEASAARDTRARAVSRSPQPRSPTSWNGLDKGDTDIAKSPGARAMVIVDGMNVNKKSKSKSKSAAVGLNESSLRKPLFSLGRKNSVSIFASSPRCLR
jgi:hypothetical protein